jgi:hypothetical protein
MAASVRLVVAADVRAYLKDDNTTLACVCGCARAHGAHTADSDAGRHGLRLWGEGFTDVDMPAVALALRDLPRLQALRSCYGAHALPLPHSHTAPH